MIISIGTDIVEIARLLELDLDKFAAKILTASEIKLLPENPEQKIRKLAKRFAAKEAIAKAFGTGIGAKLAFHDIEILNDEAGKPLAKILSKPELKIHISISDEKDFALAFAVIEAA